MSTETLISPENPSEQGISAYKFRTATEWKSLGVKVVTVDTDLPRESRETVLAFINSKDTAEVDTCEKSWMRRLESDGAKPYSIEIYTKGEGEHRSYVIPKSWVKRPYKSKQS